MMIKHLIRLFSALSFLSLGTAYARGGAAEQTFPPAYELTEYLRDPGGELTIDEVRALDDGWTPLESNYNNWGYTPDIYWLKIDLGESPWADEKSFLTIGYPTIDAIEFYQIQNGEQKKMVSTGDTRSFGQRDVADRYFVFSIAPTPGSPTQIFLKFKSGGPLKIPLSLERESEFMERQSTSQLAFGLYFGGIFVLFLYHVLLLATSRRWDLVGYVGYLLCSVSFWFTFHGFSSWYLYPNHAHLSAIGLPITLVLSNVSTLLFSVRLLNLREHMRFTSRILDGFAILNVIAFGIAVTVSYRAGVGLLTLFVIITSAMVFLSSLRTALRGFRPARFFLIGFTAYLVATVLLSMETVGAIPGGDLISYSTICGHFIQGVLMALAVGDKIRLEQETSTNIIRQLNAELVEKERARTAFFHNTSHELRTPLNGILGFLEVLQSSAARLTEAERRDKLKKIRSLAEGLKSHVNMILDIAKSKSGKLRLFNSFIPLDEMAEETRILLEGLTVQNPKVVFTVETDFAEGAHSDFIGDREKISRIIQNLVGNAAKFSKPDSQNHIGVFFSRTAGGNLEIEVTDEGIGIPSTQLDKIFEEFSQVDGSSRRRHGGTGLGLSMVRTLLDQMQGRIQVQSEEGEWTRVKVEIPSQTADPSPRKPESHWESVAASSEVAPVLLQDSEEPQTEEIQNNPVLVERDEDILVIDDNPINCEVVRDILKLKGFKVRIATGGQEGINEIKRKAPDLILLDLMMPEVSGEDVLTWLKSSGGLSEIPVMLLTARASDDDRIQGLALGADDYLPKPILSDEILLRVQNILSRVRLARDATQKLVIEQTIARAQNFNAFRMTENQTQLGQCQLIWHVNPAEVTSGDWFGVDHHVATQRTFVLVGDVTGHGVLAALFTIAVSGATKAALRLIEEKGHHISPEEALLKLAQTVNRALLDISNRLDRTMTMAFAVLDQESSTLHYLNAGHNPPLLIQDEGAGPLRAMGQPLGLSVECKFNVNQVKLQPHTCLLFYTDGLVEAGEKKMSVRKLSRDLPPNAQKIKDLVLERSEELHAGQALEDDITILILEWMPAENAQLVEDSRRENAS